MPVTNQRKAGIHIGLQTSKNIPYYDNVKPTTAVDHTSLTERSSLKGTKSEIRHFFVGETSHFPNGGSSRQATCLNDDALPSDPASRGDYMFSASSSDTVH